MKVAVALAVGAALVATLVLVLWRGLLVQHAILAGLAIGALTYYLVGTVRRLRDLYRAPGSRWRSGRDGS